MGGQHVQCPPAPAADVGHVDAGGESFVPVGQQRDHVGKQGLGEALAARFGHQRLEAGVAVVGDAAAVAERVDHLVLDLAQAARCTGSRS